MEEEEKKISYYFYLPATLEGHGYDGKLKCSSQAQS